MVAEPLIIYAAEMPSNIALIKYMGKIQGVDKNRPTNPSLSLTLPRLRSRVELYSTDERYDSWQTLESTGWIPTNLSDRGRKRYLAHFGFLKQKLNIHGNYIVRSANNFPSDCGIASSASSFAALTQAAYQLARSQNELLDLPTSKLADLSRVGSGSSIRSFMQPIVVWSSDGISPLEISFQNLRHHVVVVERGKKTIGSSDAHERVPSSLLFQGRPERAEKRLVELLAAFDNKDWRRSYEIVWAEFWDMHALFYTSQPSFGYMLDSSLKILNFVAAYWAEQNDGPIVTMDAGANVHLIFREDQDSLKKDLLQNIMTVTKDINIEIL